MFDLRQNLPAIIATSFFWIALFVAYALLNLRHPQAQPIEIIPPETPAVEATCPEPATPVAKATPAPLRVYVSGAVHHPGVYRLPPESLVVDAIEQAGGETDDADLIAINLAHPLSDGEQIYVPTQDEGAAPPPPIARTGTTDAGGEKKDNAPVGPVDLNTASQEELESLPGIGPAMAKRIIEGRPYNTVDDLLKVKGIGEAKLEKLRPHVTVQ